MIGFGLAPLKQEGMVHFEVNGIPQILPKDVYELHYGKIKDSDWVWIERRIPRVLFDKIDNMIALMTKESRIVDESD